MKILLIVDSLPPVNKISSRRAYQLAKFFTFEGHDVHIVTSDKNSNNTNGGYIRDLSSVSKSVTYLSRKFFNNTITPFEEVSKNLHEKKIDTKPVKTINFLISLLKYIKRNFVCFYSQSDLYLNKKNINLVSEIIKVNKIDIVFSSFSPAYVHKLAFELKKSNENLFWIADYRDLWALNHNVILPKFTRKLLVKYERKIIKNASLITSVSQGFIDNLKTIHGSERDYYLLPNGFDESDMFFDIKNVNSTIKKIFDNKIVISYTGSLYENNQNIKAILNAIELYSSHNIKFIFAGNELKSKIFSSHQNVHVFDSLTSNDCNYILCNSDFLLVVDWDGEYSGVIPAKIFDYMAAKKQIILQQSDVKDTELKSLLCDVGFSITLSSEADWIAFLELISTGQKDNLKSIAGINIRKFERHSQVRDLITTVLNKNV